MERAAIKELLTSLRASFISDGAKGRAWLLLALFLFTCPPAESHLFAQSRKKKPAAQSQNKQSQNKKHEASDEFAKSREDFKRATEEYKKSLEELIALYEKEVKRTEERLKQTKELYE